MERTPDSVDVAAKWCDWEIGIRREWLVTNGLGGYGSSSIAGANTRRYHGLLVAALTPPTGRVVLLSKLEETLRVNSGDASDDREFPLSTNVYPDVIHPEGCRAIASWSCDPCPTWRFSPAPGIAIKKRVWMAQGYNTTYVSYLLKEAPSGSAVLRIVPLLAWKDYHSEMRACAETPTAEWSDTASAGALEIRLPGVAWVHPYPLRLRLYVMADDGSPASDAAFAPEPDWYYRLRHPREQERGQDCEEDLYSPGAITVTLEKNRAVTIAATVEEQSPAAPAASLDAIRRRRDDLLERADSADDFTRRLVLAADQFIVRTPHGRSTIIAGYPWFNDWGRDTMIALPGVCLSTRRPEVAREILLSFAQFVDRGMLPNRFPDLGETPDYNTVDATLWYFVAVHRYCEAASDYELVRKQLWDILEGIIDWHRKGTRFNIHVDAVDGLLYAGEPGAQLTWMDAKIGDWVVTPRTGKPVEINALWINALRTMAHLAAKIGAPDCAPGYTREADRATESFLSRFVRPDGRGLYDVVDTPPSGASDPSVRPNQIFAVSLPFAPVEAHTPLARAIVDAVDSELRTDFGLRTLSPRDAAYRPRYEGDPRQRDSAYHQGTVWPWLLGPLVEAHLRVHGDREAAARMFAPLQDHLDDYGVGTIAEVYDGDAPQRPAGCIAQAWSVSETLRVWGELSQALSGVSSTTPPA